MKIEKRNGNVVEFDKDKIKIAIEKAMLETESGVEQPIITTIANIIETQIKQGVIKPHVESIQDSIEILLMCMRPDVAKRYIIYREERRKVREQGWNMDELQRNIWENKYRYKNETFNEWLDRISNGNDEIRKMILNQEFLFGGRILANRGLQNDGRKVTFSNCYVLPTPEDNIESIFDTAKQMARTYSYGGGVGISLENLRPRGAIVNNSAEETTGAVSFMKLYDATTGLIGQKGRRGALMISLPINHPDIEEFIDVKLDLNDITKANISLMVDDTFFEAYENNEPYKLLFYVEETNQYIEKVINPKELLRKIAENNWDMAEPGMLFWDRVEKWHLLSHNKDFKYSSTNPCVTGDTKILTDKGYIEIKDLVNKETNIWNGYEFSQVIPTITGRDKEILDIELSNGMVISCTQNHKFVMKDGNKIEAQNLQIGDKLIKWNYPIIESDNSLNISRKEMYTKGFFSGDGCYQNNERIRSTINIYDKKKNLIEYIDYYNIYEGEKITLELDTNKYYDKSFVPTAEYSIKNRLDWLAGILDSDGGLNDKSGSLGITSINKEFLSDIQLMLSTLGCHSSINICHNEGIKKMPDGEGGLKEYKCNISYRLVISAFNVKKLMDLGLKTNRVELIANPNRDASRFIYIKDIKKREEIEKYVYCFTEHKKHTGVFNGILTGQCGELPLPNYGACLLGSINLAKFVIEPYSEYPYIDVDRLGKVVRHAVIALNEVLDEGIPLHPLKEQSEYAKQYRPIGLGVMGFADMLIMMGIEYGSGESILLADNLAKFILNQALLQSALLAKEYGTYPAYTDDIFNSDFYKSTVDNETQGVIRAYGLRNSHVLSIAPTGSISTMIGVSGGIEPLFATHFNRTTKSLHDTDVVYKIYPKVIKEFMEHTGLNDSEFPDYIKTAHQIHWQDRINVQATWQIYVDSAISSTINLPNETTVEEIMELYYNAWKSNLKGVTIYRDGCNRGGILTAVKTKEVCPECKGEIEHKEGCISCPNCGWGQCSI